MLDSKRGRGGWTVSGAGECNLAGKARLAVRLVGWWECKHSMAVACLGV